MATLGNLEIIDLVQGTFSLLFVIISLIIGITILFKYFKFKSKIFILMGLSWIGLASPWFPDSISFLIMLFGGSSIPIDLYLLIGNVLLPFFLLIWIWAFSELLYKDKQKLLLAIFLILAIIFEATFFLLYNIDIETYLGEYQRVFQIEFKEFLTLYLVGFVIILLITGVLFARNSLKSENPEVKVKGKFLMAAFISFCIGALLDAITGLIFTDILGLLLTSPVISIFVGVVRSILILSAIEFYIGFILPPFVKKIFQKKE
ncbi:MAG: hypothetical protein ACQERB_01030 [Promethearchaeati archaeon]